MDVNSDFSSAPSSPRFDEEDPFGGNNEQSNIMVAVRVRPESSFEKSKRYETKNPSRHVVKIVDDNMLVFDPTEDDELRNSPHKRRTLGVRRGKDLRFVFDKVFDETATQRDVFESTIKHLLSGVLEGYNSTVFAYGATGAGKTFTMLGSEDTPGVMYLAMIDLFGLMEKTKQDKQYKVTISYLEVYNETIRDLLAPENVEKSDKKELEVREDRVRGVIVTGLSEHSPQNADDVLSLLKLGNDRRTMYGTAANAQSSRSHAVFQVMIEQKDRASNVKTDVKVGKLSLIDLAGSERASATQNRGARLVEGANINKSLLALANCINALGKKNGSKYVPYRNSKLTRLLKDSLGGNCRTIMIANVSPSSLSYEDTYNTLRYANRTKNIKVHVKKNILNVNMHVSQYRKIIDELRQQVSALQARVKRSEQREKEEQRRKMEEEEAVSEEKKDMLRIQNVMQRITTEHATIMNNILTLEESDRQSALEILKKNQQIRRWEIEHPLSDTPPLGITTAQKDIEVFKNTREMNLAKKLQLEKRLDDILREFKIIQEAIPVKISNPQFRETIDQGLRIHYAEKSKLDLERLVLLHRAREERASLMQEDGAYALAAVRSTLETLYKKLQTTDMAADVESEYLIALNLANPYALRSEDDSIIEPAAAEPDEVSEAFRTPKGVHTKSIAPTKSSSPPFKNSPTLGSPLVSEDQMLFQKITPFTFTPPQSRFKNPAETGASREVIRDRSPKKIEVTLIKNKTVSAAAGALTERRERARTPNGSIKNQELADKLKSVQEEWTQFNQKQKKLKTVCDNLKKQSKLEGWGYQNAIPVQKSPPTKETRDALRESAKRVKFAESTNFQSSSFAQLQLQQQQQQAASMPPAKLPNYMSATASSKNRFTRQMQDLLPFHNTSAPNLVDQLYQRRDPTFEFFSGYGGRDKENAPKKPKKPSTAAPPPLSKSYSSYSVGFSNPSNPPRPLTARP